MLDQPLLLLFLQPAEAIQLFVDFVMLGAHIVQQVIVKIPRAGLLQLGVEDLVPVLQVVDKACVQLVRQREGFPRMTAGQAGPDGILALERAVHPGRIKIGEPPLQKGIHHLFGLLHIDAARIVGVGQRQTHQAKAQFFCTMKNIHRLVPPCVIPADRSALLFPKVLYNLKRTSSQGAVLARFLILGCTFFEKCV